MTKYTKKFDNVSDAKSTFFYAPTVLSVTENFKTRVLWKDDIQDNPLFLKGDTLNELRWTDSPLCFTAHQDNSTVSMVQEGEDSTAYDLQVSSDGFNWVPYTLGTVITLNTGEKSFWRGNNEYISGDSDNYKHFVMTGSIGASGNTNSLLDADDFDSMTEISSDYCYYYMFYGCTALTAAPELPATTLAGNCYGSMFRNCTSLTTAPELPATSLAGNCYDSMFYGCTSLTTAPELPATTLATYCYYYMFYGCTALTAAPELPATSLASSCYGSMFLNCTSLTTAPELPATTLVSGCYTYMFSSCTQLNYIKCLATTNISGNTNNWLYGVASSGTFVKDSSTTWATGTSGIPDGWNIVIDLNLPSGVLWADSN